MTEQDYNTIVTQKFDRLRLLIRSNPLLGPGRDPIVKVIDEIHGWVKAFVGMAAPQNDVAMVVPEDAQEGPCVVIGGFPIWTFTDDWCPKDKQRPWADMLAKSINTALGHGSICPEVPPVTPSERARWSSPDAPWPEGVPQGGPAEIAAKVVENFVSPKLDLDGEALVDKYVNENRPQATTKTVLSPKGGKNGS